MNKLKYLATVILMSARLFAADSSFPADGAYKADAMTVGLPPAAEEIGTRMQAAIKADPEWFKTYVAQHKGPGQPLPYDKKLGITEVEYKIFVEAAGHLTLNKVADAIVHIERSAAKLTVKIEGPTFPIDTFEFTLDEATMKCLTTTSAAPTPINQANESAPTGAWTGKQWAILQGSTNGPGTEDAYELRFAKGKDTQSRDLIFIRMVGRKAQTPIDFTCILRWPQDPVK